MIIQGSIHTDSRGTVRFVNDFDMSKVVRMYCIEPKTGVIRAWQGHKKETKWFYAARGSFRVQTVAMDTKCKKQYSLSAAHSQVLEIPGGHYNGFEAREEGSVLMVFSDLSLEESKMDDWRESLDNIGW
jgi:dTDP-4-dehydrorhamnose 3,5-epimerase